MLASLVVIDIQYGSSDMRDAVKTLSTPEQAPLLFFLRCTVRTPRNALCYLTLILPYVTGHDFSRNQSGAFSVYTINSIALGLGTPDGTYIIFVCLIYILYVCMCICMWIFYGILVCKRVASCFLIGRAWRWRWCSVKKGLLNGESFICACDC